MRQHVRAGSHHISWKGMGMATKKKSSSGTGSRRSGSSSKKKSSKRRYSPKASQAVGQEMHEMKRGKLRSGRSGKKVKNRKQAIAIGLSKARKKGAKVPRPKRRSSR